MVLGDDRQGRPVAGHSQGIHAPLDVLADWVGGQWRLILIGAERLVLLGACPVYADHCLGGRIVGFKLVIGQRPIARLTPYVILRIVPQAGPSLIEGVQTKVERGEAQRDATVELGATPDHLRGVALDGGPVPPVGAEVDVWLVVDIGLDMTGKVGDAPVGDPGHANTLLRAGREELISLEVAQPSGRLVLRQEERPLVEEQDRFPRSDQCMGDGGPTGAAADDDRVKLRADHRLQPR
jgi:hypothetical protein